MAGTKTVNLSLEGKTVGQVKSFEYLGSLVTWNRSCTAEIKSRISMGNQAFEKMKWMLIEKRIQIELRNSPNVLFGAWCYMATDHRQFTKKEESYLYSFVV